MLVTAFSLQLVDSLQAEQLEQGVDLDFGVLVLKRGRSLFLFGSGWGRDSPVDGFSRGKSLSGMKGLLEGVSPMVLSGG